jgi:thiaminase
MSGDDVRLKALDEKLSAAWRGLFQRSRLVRTIEKGELDRRLYALYLFETYHYTAHNARNQALVGVRAVNPSDAYMKFCFEHANEEVGHEQMAMHDILSLGLRGVEFEIPRPRPATEVLIAYLYWVSATGNPLRRLGYSYWAEGSYQYITPLLERVQKTLSLTPNQMTFFTAHARIDEKHADEVRHMVASQCQTEQDWRDVEDVMLTSLSLTGGMMEGVYDEYERVLTGRSTEYKFLSSLS